MSLLLDDPKRQTWSTSVPRVTFGGIRDGGVNYDILKNAAISIHNEPMTLSELEAEQIEEDYWKSVEDEARVDFI